MVLGSRDVMGVLSVLGMLSVLGVLCVIYLCTHGKRNIGKRNILEKGIHCNTIQGMQYGQVFRLSNYSDGYWQM